MAALLEQMLSRPAGIGMCDRYQPSVIKLLRTDKQIKIATWNASTLFQGEEFDNLVKEAKRLNLDILGVSETRWSGIGRSKRECYEFIYSGAILEKKLSELLKVWPNWTTVLANVSNLTCSPTMFPNLATMLGNKFRSKNVRGMFVRNLATIFANNSTHSNRSYGINMQKSLASIVTRTSLVAKWILN